MKHTHWVTLSLLIGFVTGCTENTTTEFGAVSDSVPQNPDEAIADSFDPTPESSETETAPEVSAAVRSWDDVQNWVAGQKGKVVVIDVWSTYCASCMEEFPHFVALHERLGDQVACASVDIDYYGAGETPEKIQPRVLEFLTKQKATTANFVSSTADEEILEELGVAAIPVAIVFDQAGKLRKTFSNDIDEYGPHGFSYEKDINPFVEELTKSGGGQPTDGSVTVDQTEQTE